MMFIWKDEKNEKEVRDGPFKKTLRPRLIHGNVIGTYL